jgi:2-dehydro-3-deoxyphosphogluconate aldolase/(4S)-4-hydroxy-2-oxoglutarate aldolase
MQTTIEAFANNKHTLITILDMDDSHSMISTIEALTAGGVQAIEIPLRRDNSLQNLAIAREQFPDITLCAGTVISPQQVAAVAEISVDFAISPGMTPSLLEQCNNHNIDILPGISTASDIMLGIAHGLTFFKFFPAQILGGIDMLNAFNGPFKHCHFCASGGINLYNMQAYLQLPNIFSVAGSWLATQEQIQQKNWQAITDNAKHACRLAGAT